MVGVPGSSPVAPTSLLRRLTFGGCITKVRAFYLQSEISQTVNLALTKSALCRNLGKVLCDAMKTKQITTSVIFTLFALVAGAVQTSSAAAETLPPNGSELKFVGRYSTGAGLGGAEISAVDAASKRLFITNGAKNTIDIVDISNVKKPKLIKAVSLTANGVTGIQSVAAKNGVVLVAAMMASKTDPGRIFVMDVNGKLRTADGIAVGALPDSVTISPNGKFAIVANEGEPTNYCLTNGALPETTDPLGSVSIINLSSKTPTATTIDFKSYSERQNAITYAGGRIFGPNASVAQDLEPEYAAFSADSKFAFVTLQENNAVATVDVETGAIINIVGLGVKNHNLFNAGLDSSDRDNKIDIVARNIQGMYLPDAIGTVDAGGNTYMITANEGDAREYACLLGGTDATKVEAEDPRFADVADTTVDATFKGSTIAGRMKVTQFSPANISGEAIRSTTKVLNAFSFGTRSFTVWKTNLNNGVFPADLVFDSGDAIERIIAQERPRFFNADWNTTSGFINAFEARSASKGPEPEGLAIGKAYGRTWMVLALERDNGLMLYDVTNPVNPKFRQYINISIPGGDIQVGSGGDVSPEGVLFLEAAQSPTGKPMVVVSYELSGSVAFFEVSAPGSSK